MITAETNTLIEIPRSSHFLQSLGPAILSIKNATEILPMPILNMHRDRDIVFSSKALVSWVGVR